MIHKFQLTQKLASKFTSTRYYCKNLLFPNFETYMSRTVVLMVRAAVQTPSADEESRMG